MGKRLEQRLVASTDIVVAKPEDQERHLEGARQIYACIALTCERTQEQGNPRDVRDFIRCTEYAHMRAKMIEHLEMSERRTLAVLEYSDDAFKRSLSILDRSLTPVRK